MRGNNSVYKYDDLLGLKRYTPLMSFNKQAPRTPRSENFLLDSRSPTADAPLDFAKGYE